MQEVDGQFEYAEEFEREFARQVTARDNRDTFLWNDPLMQVVIEEAGMNKDYMEVAALVKQKRDSGYVRNRLPTGHPARQWLKVWDRLGYEEDQTGNGTGTILMILDTTRLCILRGTNEEGEIYGSLRKKVTEWLHIPHLGEVKTSWAAEARYYWPAMYNKVLQKVKDCEVCLINSKSRPVEPPPLREEFS